MFFLLLAIGTTLRFAQMGKFMALLGFSSLLIVAPVQAQQRPNIIFIYADDLGYGDIGVYGAKAIKTPNIDSLAHDGVMFDSFYSASPVCSPSRAALLTGRYPIRQGIHTVFYPESYQGLPSEETTIAEVLQGVGYRTGLVGKWHLGHHEQYMPWNHGFDEFFGVPYSNDMGGFYFFRDKEIIFDDIDQRFLTKTYTQEALEFIDRNKDGPFFLYLAHNMPHVPLYASPQFEGKSKGGLYGDVVEELDWSVGRILERIKTLGLDDNTLVIFTSDNGPWRIMGKDGGSSGPLRAGKQFTFEGGMRVPALARWPGSIAAGSRVSGLATMMDWLPTFASLGGAALPSELVLDGEDISSLLLGQKENEARELFYYMNGELRAYRQGKWKLKLPYNSPVGRWSFLHEGLEASHDVLLFDLSVDPGERENLASLHMERVGVMQEEIRAFQRSLGELPSAMHTGKNMDYGPYMQLVLGLLSKVILGILVLILALYLLWMRFRGLHKR